MPAYAPLQQRDTLASIYKRLIDAEELESFEEAGWALETWKNPKGPYPGPQSEVGILLTRADTSDARDRLKQLRSLKKGAQRQHEKLHEISITEAPACTSAATCAATGKGSAILATHRRFSLALEREEKALQASMNEAKRQNRWNYNALITLLNDFSLDWKEIALLVELYEADWQLNKVQRWSRTHAAVRKQATRLGLTEPRKKHE